MDRLSEIVGFKAPVHKELSTKFGRDIIDISKFIDLYYDKYGICKMYPDMRERFGPEPEQIIVGML